MTDDQTPEARLAAALKAARLEAADPPYRHYPEMASDVFAADPTLAADLALAAAVRAWREEHPTATFMPWFVVQTAAKEAERE